MANSIKRVKEAGLTIPEALVSMAIAAGVVTAASTSLSTSLNLTAKSEDAAIYLMEAQNIASLLRSDIPLSDIKRDFDHWNIQDLHIDTGLNQPHSQYALQKITVVNPNTPSLNFSVIRIVETS